MKMNKLSGKAMLLLMAFFTVMLLTGCIPRIVVSPRTPDIVLVSQGTPATGTAAPMGNWDRHFIQPDDYFVLDTPLDNSVGWVYARVAKMITPPSDQTANQAQFMFTNDGTTVWTRHYFRTRIATRADLQLGKQVFALDVADMNSYYRAPESNQEARSGWWFTSRIVDTSELFKNVVMVADGFKINENAIRVIAE